MFNAKNIGPATYEIPATGGMRVPGLIIATEELMKDMDIEQPLAQVCNVAHLPGIVGYSIAMPDIHWGYGFPIGGVAAMDAEEGVISPGGVGYDINCGVRLAVAPEEFKNLSDGTKEQLLKKIFAEVPSGVGKGRKTQALTDEDYRNIVDKGVRWSIEQGFGFEEDIHHAESHGHIEGGDIKAVSRHARDRGKSQIGTIGSGNHFVEIGEIQEIYLPEIAAQWGIHKGQVYILIHSGSRGFGHQVCQDTLDVFVKLPETKELPDRQLTCAPIKSEHGKRYFQAMAAAANFAFNNRQRILHSVRQSFQEVLGTDPREIRLIYDVCHNIAKFEEYEVHGKKKKLCVHRKGATRAFGPGHPELAKTFQKTGQPVLVPGDMGRASHLLVGLGNLRTWCSCCHGAGRAMSRQKSKNACKGIDLKKNMLDQGVIVEANSYATIAEEMPFAYKDVDMVVLAVEKAGLANRVAKMKPHLVVKG